MRRRQVLAALGATGVGGCLSRFRPADGSPSDPVTTSTTTRTTSQPTTTGTATSSPDVGCPPGSEPDEVSRVLCFDGSPPEDADLSLEASGDGPSLPTGDLTFTLTNRSDREFTTNFYSWGVWRHEDGDWFHVAPRGYPVPAMIMQPGDSHAWTLAVDNSDLDRPVPRTGGTESATVVGLGGGTYAFAIDGWFADSDYEHQTLAATRFAVDGPPLALRALPRVSVVGRDGDALTVRDPEKDGNDRLATYVVTRVSDPDGDPRRLVTEQVVRRTNLRNALAHFESGVRQVRLKAYTSAYPAFRVHPPRFVAYDGDTYRITVEDPNREE